MTKVLETHQTRAVGRLYTVLNGQWQTVVDAIPSGAPWADHEGDGVVTVPGYIPEWYYGFPNAVPYPVTDSLAGFLTVAHISNGDPATGGALLRREVHRVLRLGVYLMFMQPAGGDYPTLGGKTLDPQEFGWWGAQAYGDAVEYIVQRYLANGDDVQHVIEKVTDERGFSGDGELHPDVGGHWYALLEFDVGVDVDLPQNLFDV